MDEDEEGHDEAGEDLAGEDYAVKGTGIVNEGTEKLPRQDFKREQAARRGKRRGGPRGGHYNKEGRDQKWIHRPHGGEEAKDDGWNVIETKVFKKSTRGGRRGRGAPRKFDQPPTD